jgi:excisionase family DNA binding protein
VSATPDPLAPLVEAIAEQLAPHVAELLAEARPAEQRTPWLDVDEAAEYLRLRARDGKSWSREAVYKLTAAKAIPHHRIGSRVLFRRDELDAWMDENYEGPPRAIAPLRAVGG